ETNLRKAFPHYPVSKLQKIKQKFYLFFANLMVQTIANFGLSKKKAAKSLQIENVDELKKLWQKHSTIIAVMGHFGNGETIIPRLPLHVSNKVYALYKPLSNTTINTLIIKNRTRFGLNLIKMKETFRVLLKKQNEKKLVVFIGDQSPFPENAYWTTFLNQPTAVYTGAEKMAVKLKSPVVFLTVMPLGFENYKIKINVITENPESNPEGYITKMHTQKLEKEIINAPEFWLWSHRRWKHKPPENAHVN